MQHWSAEQFLHQLLNNDIVALSRAITLVESQHLKHYEKAKKLIQLALPHSGKSIRIGITGVPGAGKSTFIEAFGNLLLQNGKKVAVLAVDPSSSLHKGSILGDKTRMETLVQHPNAFIRPSASGTNLGGVTQKTREAIILCEAAGFDLILIETVGVGQSEIAVHGMTDFFLLLQIAGAGDELQGIKRGIMEMCDAVVINKSDGDNEWAAKNAQQQLENALHLYEPKWNGWTPKVMTCSALNNVGIDTIWNLVKEYLDFTKTHNTFDIKRQNQDIQWVNEMLEQAIKEKFYQKSSIQKELPRQFENLKQQKTTPFEVVSVLLSLYDKD